MRDDDTRQDPPANAYIDTGGCAFPDVVNGRHGPVYMPGMTLRDYFAGQWLTQAAAYCQEGDRMHGAVTAYLWADAMLIARR